MKELLAGYRRFRTHGWREHSREFESLAKNGQSPKALVVTCIDSRIDPAMIFDAHPGEILTVRNVANLVPPYAPDAAYHGTSAAIEFGVQVMQVRHVIVLGHGLCGGVQTLLQNEGGGASEFITPWMSIAAAARERALACAAGGERQRRCEQEVIRTSLANLMSFPWVARRVQERKLELHGMWFDIASGALEMLQREGEFAAVS